MRATVVGMQVMDFVARDSGEAVQGLYVYAYAPDDRTFGFLADKKWVRKGTELYDRLVKAAEGGQFAEPVEADFVYEVTGVRGNRTVLSDIVFYPKKAERNESKASG